MTRTIGYCTLLVGVMLWLSTASLAELRERDILMTLGMMEYASVNNLPDGWSVVQQTIFAYTAGLDTTTHSQGRSSLKFSTSNAPPGSTWNLRCSVKVGRNGLKIGDRLTMRAQVKTGALLNAAVRVSLAAVRTDGSTITANEWRVETPNTDWQPCQISIVVPEGTDRVSAGIVFNVRGSGSGDATFWVDDITLTNGEMLEIPVTTRRNIRTYTLFAVHPDIYETARRYDMVMLHPLDWIYARPLKYYNPNVEVYVYCSSVATSSSIPGWMDPLDYEYVTTTRRDWLLTDLQGKPIPELGHPDNLLVDLGRADLQQRWASRVTQLAQRCGFDGVFIDSMTYNYLSLAGVTCQQYANDAAFQAAQTSFISTVAPILRQAGLKVVQNFGYVWSRDLIYQTWMQDADAILAENWVRVKSGDTLFFLHPVIQLQHIDSLNVPRPVRYLVQGRATAAEEQTRRYLLGCALLNANQYTWFHISPQSYKQTPDYLLDYELPIGQPTETYVLIAGDRNSGGVFRRRFSNGLVLVNMHPSQTFSVPVDADYVDVTGKLYRQGTVDLSPQSALVLAKPNNSLQITVSPDTTLTPQPGDTVRFTVNITNTTSAPVNVLAVRVPIPASMQFVLGSASDGGIYDETTRTVTWFISTLPASQTVTRTFYARVQ